MNRRTTARLIESFSRNWVLYVLPLAVMVALGTLVALDSTDEFTADAVIFVDGSSFVTARTGVGSAEFTYLSPAQFTTQEMAGLRDTYSFMESVIDNAGFELSPISAFRFRQVRIARDAVAVFPTGNNLLKLRVTIDDPSTAVALGEAFVEAFIQFKIDFAVAESQASATFFTDLIATYEDDLSRSRSELDEYLSQIPDTTLENLTAGQQQELDRLTGVEARARDRYEDAIDDVDLSVLAELQAKTQVRGSYSIVDAPQVTEEAEGGITGQILTVAMFTLVGIVLAMVGPVLAATVNPSVQFPEDLAHVEGPGVVAILPKLSRGDLRLSSVPVPERTVTNAVAREQRSDTATAHPGSGPAASTATPTGSDDQRPVEGGKATSRWARGA